MYIVDILCHKPEPNHCHHPLYLGLRCFVILCLLILRLAQKKTKDRGAQNPIRPRYHNLLFPPLLPGLLKPHGMFRLQPSRLLYVPQLPLHRCHLKVA
jgi:hypothetical protein